MDNISVTLVCISKFHHFALARELLKYNMLKYIFTGYPLWKVKDEDIPSKYIRTYPWFQPTYMALAKWKLLGHGLIEKELFWYAHETLDHYVSNNLPKTDILFALSGSGLNCGKKAKQNGIKYICDRGSSHIRYQNNILQEEYKIWGQQFKGIDPRIILKEEQEYDTADCITIPSTFAYKSFIEMGIPKSKLYKIPYGVDLRRFHKICEPDPNRFDVLFVGQVSFRKGIPYLFDAFKKLKHPNKYLTIIGSIQPEIKDYLKNKTIPENVQFLGSLPQIELKYFMSKSHVMVLPSIEEGLAYVQAQALACGCPVIGTNHSGAEDLFTDGKEGFIVPIRDPEIIAEKLQEFADDPEKRRDMSSAAVKLVSNLGGWHKYGAQITQIFQGLVKDGLSFK